MGMDTKIYIILPLSPIETLPKPWPRMKPSPQRRAVSVHEDALLQHAALLDPEGKPLFSVPTFHPASKALLRY